MHGRTSPVAALALLTILLFAPAALAADARYEGISSDGSVAFFSTADPLVPGDTDIRRDVYERSFDDSAGGYVTRLVSIGPSGGADGIDAEYYGTSEDGERVFFFTAERLTPDDKDNVTDLYVRDLVAKTTERISVPGDSCAATNCGNAAQHAGVVTGGVLPGGGGAFFSTGERLVAEDIDSSQDIYLRDLDEGETILVTRGASSCAPGCGNGPIPVSFGGSSADGRRVAFTTTEAMVPGDGAATLDVFLRDLDAGATQRVSAAGECVGGQGCDPIFVAISGDGGHVYFETGGSLEEGDEDDSQDVYAWSGGEVERVSLGPSGGNGAHNARFRQLADDRDAAFFLTQEQLTPDDADAADDVYERDLDTGTTRLVSVKDSSCGSCTAGLEAVLPLGGVAAEGPRVLFLSEDRMTAADDDDAFDVYERNLDTGTMTLVSRGDSSCAPSCGNQDRDANFAGASADGSRAFFVTDESLAPADGDLVADVYERSDGTTRLVSTGQMPGSGTNGADLFGVSDDGSAAFFVTKERLTVDDDSKGDADVFSRSGVGTLLVSTGNGDLEETLAPPPPVLSATSPPSPGTATSIRVVGTAQPGSSIKIYLDSACSGEPAAIGTAEELESPGIPVTVPAGWVSELFASAEADGIVSECSDPLEYEHRPPQPPGGGSGGGGKSGGGEGTIGKPIILGDGVEDEHGRVWIVPRTRITFAPAGKTRVRRPVFRFADVSGQPGTRFRCRVDRGRWAPCGSPIKLKRQRLGRHVFQVKAVNAIGQWEPRPVKRAFTLVRSR